MILEVAFWLSLFFLIHSYIGFPLLVMFLAKIKGKQKKTKGFPGEWPLISVIMSVYNEEEILSKKIESVFTGDYPIDKIEFIIGSDASTDKTNAILDHYAHPLREKYNVVPVIFNNRTGKPGILNEITKRARGEILILTDAKAIFTDSTIINLVKHFNDTRIHLVGGNLVNLEHSQENISIQEMTFMSSEIRLKYREGHLWGCTIGAYGAIYAIRKESFSWIPQNYSVDDFYVTMKVIKKGFKAIMDLDAICYENVPGVPKEEFRRKVRISAGNFQNLASFVSILWPPWKAVAFAFFSHKVLRWLGPFLLIIIFAANSLLALHNNLYLVLLCIQLFFYSIPVIDYLLRKINLHIVILRFVTHFINMNLALFTGFIKYTKGIKTNVWEPTTRNQ